MTLRRRRLTVLTGFVAGILVILALAATLGRRRVERELTVQALAAANRAWPDGAKGTAPLKIRFEGRRAVVSGAVPDATSHLLVVQAVRRTPGVRQVDDRIVAPSNPTTPLDTTLDVAESADGPLTVDVLRARLVDGRVTLEGTIADRGAHIRLVEQLLKRLKGRLADQLVRTPPADGQAAVALVPSFGSLIIAAADRMDNGSISLSDSTLVLLGTARSEADREAIQRSATRLTSRWKVVNALQTPPPAPSEAEVLDTALDGVSTDGGDAADGDATDGDATDGDAPAVDVLAGPQGQLDELLSTASLERNGTDSDFTPVSGLVLDEVARLITDAQDNGAEIGEIEVDVRADASTPNADARARQIVQALQSRGVAGVVWLPVGLGTNTRPTGEGPALAVRVVLKAPPPPPTTTSVPAPTDSTDSTAR